MTQHRNIVTRTWGSSVGKKSVMAVTGVIFLLYVVAHMIGNLKIFFGQETFDAYSEHLRSLGAEIFEKRESVLVGHDDVGEDEIEVLGLGEIKGLRGVVADCGFVTAKAECAGKGSQRVGFIVDD